MDTTVDDLVTSDGLDADLGAALRAAAAAPRLLVGCDVDGTIAPIAARPEDALVDPSALSALRDLASQHGTTVALVSGRRLRDLRAMTRPDDSFVLVGSHGAEHDSHVALSPAAAQLLEQLLRDLRAVADGVPGVLLEEKAAGVAVHVRLAERSDAARVLAEVEAGASRRRGVRTTHGKEVVELSVVDVDKGRALDRLRAESGADAVVYVGDDVTDEAAFARLAPPDVGLKVGDGATAAAYRVPTTDDAILALHLLAGARRPAPPA